MSIESRPVIEDVLYSVQHIDVVDLTQSVLRLDEYPIAGGFSEVYRCRLALTSVDVSVRRAISHYGLPSTTTSVDVAVKKARKRMNDATDMKVIDRSFREIKIWMRLEHENIVPIWGVTDGFGSVPALVMPWLENGALTGYIQREHRALSHSQKFTLLRDVARGLQYLHSQSTIHGDLSGNNVLVDQDGKASLSDFGLSLFLPEILSEALVPTNLYGTIAYMPPEYLTSDDDDNPPLVHSTASDVYSFGGIMLLVLEGKPPYYYIRSMMRIMMMKSRGMTPRRPSESVMSDSEWNFLRSCWSEDMDKRPLDCEILAFVEERLEPRYS
ncbi:kinase-like domain-containing protein [Suillus spraguei]|nr:kinase-like domain-containing protein [Suillus spraguei]